MLELRQFGVPSREHSEGISVLLVELASPQQMEDQGEQHAAPSHPDFPAPEARRRGEMHQDTARDPELRRRRLDEHGDAAREREPENEASRSAFEVAREACPSDRVSEKT